MKPINETRQDPDSRWMADALCAQTGGDWWFVPDTRDHVEEIRNAKQTCQLCHVTTHCLEYALLNDERFGIWGGLTALERQRLRKDMNLPPPPPPEDWHGTDAGAKRHYRAGEPPCWECRTASMIAKREYRNRQPTETSNE